MSLYKLTEQPFYIDKCLFYTEEYEYKDSKMSLVPLIDFDESEFKELSLKKGTNKIGYDNSSNHAITYLKFELLITKDVEINMSIHNNLKKTKIWINEYFLVNTMNWYERLILNLKKGKYVILLEVGNIDKYADFLITFHSLNSPILEIEGNKFYDELRDIRKNYIETSDSYIKETTLFSVRSNYYIDECRSINCFFVKHNLEKINTEKEYELLMTQTVEIGKNYNLKIDNILEKSKTVRLLLCVNIDGSDEFTGIDNCFCKSIYTINPEIEILKNKIEELTNEKNLGWRTKYITPYKKYLEYKLPITLDIDCYMYITFYKYILQLKSFENEKEYLYTQESKKIYDISRLDNLPIQYSIYVPNNLDENIKTPLLLILSSNGSSTYISNFSSMYPEGYIIMECAIRGKSFGNNIANSTVLEAIDFIRSKYNIDEKKIVLFGHSSNGTTAGTMASYFPDMFNRIFIVSCLNDLSLIENKENTLVLNICGDKDEFKNLNYTYKSKRTKSFANYINIIAENFNNALSTIFLNNKQIIDYFLTREIIKTNDLFYKVNNLHYNSAFGISIIKKSNNSKSASFKYLNEENKLILDNVSIVKINLPVAKKISVVHKSVENTVYVQSNPIYFQVKGKEIKEYNKISYFNNVVGKLEILNIYTGSLKIYCNTISRNEALVKKFSKPRSLIHNAPILVNYHYDFVEQEKLSIDNNTNYVLINFEMTKFTNIYDEIGYVKCYKDGFSYDGVFYEGNYSIIQVLPNFESNSNYIAYINYNSEESLIRNFYLRNIIIPSDLSKNNSIYRNYAIIYFNNKIHIISKPSSKIKLYLSKS